MKNIGWGTRITIGISIYVVGIISFVIFSTTQQINLVTKEYYPKGIDYETKIQKIKNAYHLEQKVAIANTNNFVEILFPEKMIDNIKGEIILYRTSDYELDKKYEIITDKSGKQLINTSALKNGRYIVKIDWKAQDINYYMEQGIFISK